MKTLSIKKISLILLTLLTVSLSAQVSKYDFTKETGQPWDITMYPDINITNHTVNDDVVLPAKVALGFPFMFNGVVYDSVGISENGFIWFGAEQANTISAIVKPISGVSSPKVRGIVSALGDDLHPHVNTGLTTTIKSGVTGIAPMRELIIEWKNTSRFNSLADAKGEDTITFQIKLYQFMNRVEIAYGQMNLNPNITSQVEIGLKGALIGDFNNRMTDATHNWLNSLKGTAKTSTCELKKTKQPVFGDMYVWMDLNQSPQPDPTGTEEINSTTTKAYPVPATTTLFVETAAVLGQQIAIYDITGRMQKVQPTVGTITELNLEGLGNGFYLFAVLSPNAEVVSTGRFSIVK